MDFAPIFKALGDETRLRILNLTIQIQGRIFVCEMEEALQLPQYTVSKALCILRQAGLVVSGKLGTWVYNELNTESELICPLFQFLKSCLKNKYSQDIERLKTIISRRDDAVCGNDRSFEDN